MAETAKSIYRNGRRPADVPLYSFAELIKNLRIPPDDSEPLSLRTKPEVVPLELPRHPVPGLPGGFTGYPVDPTYTFRQMVDLFLERATIQGWSWRHVKSGVGRYPAQLEINLRLGSNHLFGKPDRAAHDPRMELYRSRVEYDEDQIPTRLYPFTRSQAGEHSPRVVAIDPRFNFGVPIVARRCVRVDVIASRFRAGESVADLAEDYELTPVEVEEAIRFDSE